ncbi:hypothetical protein L083_1705 [Actinoplanes sp. N902-109]|nr:hypothetical protein L083_1705 [Actinoplanes sp. N902-109]
MGEGYYNDGGHVLDAGSLDEIRADLLQTAQVNTMPHRLDLAALEAVIAEPHPPGTLARLVGWEANRVLDDPSDAGAAEFLRQLACMLRDVLDEV